MATSNFFFPIGKLARFSVRHVFSAAAGLVLAAALFASTLPARAQDDSADAAHQGSLIKLARILDRIVADDSKGWYSNRYVSGSMHDVQVISHSGNEYVVHGNYRYLAGGQTPSEGWVNVKIVDYEPVCLTYWDFADTCRPPN